MNNLKRNKNVLYLCQQVENNGRLEFSKPIKLKLNYQPVSMTGEIISFGSEFINKLVIYTTDKVAKQFHNFDRCYIYTKPPKDYDKFASEADFYINGNPAIFLTEAIIYLQRMTGDYNG